MTVRLAPEGLDAVVALPHEGFAGELHEDAFVRKACVHMVIRLAKCRLLLQKTPPERGFFRTEKG